MGFLPWAGITTVHFGSLQKVMDDCQDEDEVAAMFTAYVSILKDLEQAFKEWFHDLEDMG